MSEDAREAMRDLMRSGRAAQLMDGMMRMARRMDNGDVMLGTRMTEMMSRLGGMMAPMPSQPKP